MIKKLIAFLILLALAYFPVGYFAVTKNWITMTLFLSIGSGIGGLASIFSLISFIRPPLTRDDIKNLDWESVAQVAAREKEITKLEEQKSKQISELSELEKRKIEMEALAKKATMEFFLKNQFEEAEKRIKAHINNNLNPDFHMTWLPQRQSNAQRKQKRGIQLMISEQIAPAIAVERCGFSWKAPAGL